ncbi:MAG: DUF433 domain-containing protein [Leptospiraceae bacterium]|nr:DUF433 domain-containing protein [Leptospiraceae bacterium]MCP5512418.1 DUF433 domain-containing protein [Leptospiraceae bacterium]
MTPDELLKRITLNPIVCFRKPTIRNHRYSVEWMLDLLGSGMPYEEILGDYEDLEREDIQACLVFASRKIMIFLILSLYTSSHK